MSETTRSRLPRAATATSQGHDAARRSETSVVELAEDWLAAKQLTGRSETDNSAQARRRDLCRWGRALQTTLGRGSPRWQRRDAITDRVAAEWTSGGSRRRTPPR
jgi:hypothetical protein